MKIKSIVTRFGAAAFVKVAFVAAAICAAGTVTAATWVGGTSSDVGDPTNWDTQTVPGSSDAVTINKNSPVATISSGQTYTWYRLLIANGANTSGTLTVLAGASLRTSNGDDILSNGNTALPDCVHLTTQVLMAMRQSILRMAHLK